MATQKHQSTVSVSTQQFPPPPSLPPPSPTELGDASSERDNERSLENGGSQSQFPDSGGKVFPPEADNEDNLPNTQNYIKSQTMGNGENLAVDDNRENCLSNGTDGGLNGDKSMSKGTGTNSPSVVSDENQLLQVKLALPASNPMSIKASSCGAIKTNKRKFTQGGVRAEVTVTPPAAPPPRVSIKRKSAVNAYEKVQAWTSLLTSGKMSSSA